MIIIIYLSVLSRILDDLSTWGLDYKRGKK